MNIAISGSTCSGKSTLIKLLLEEPMFRGRSTVISEHASDNPFLGVFEKTFQSQMFFYVSYLKDVASLDEKKDDYVFFDRTIDEYMLISRFRYKNGELSADEYALCQELALLIKDAHPQIDKTVFLYCSSETAQARQKKRNDKALYSRTFLDDLNTCYRDYAKTKRNILMVDTDQGLDIGRIVDFITQ